MVFNEWFGAVMQGIKKSKLRFKNSAIEIVSLKHNISKPVYDQALHHSR